MSKRRAPPDELQAHVLLALWAADQPLTVADIAAHIGLDDHHHTVRAAPDRLQSQGAIDDVTGRSRTYRPRTAHVRTATQQLHTALHHTRSQLTVLNTDRCFAGTLTPDEPNALPTDL
ncbi:BlaI/MecI/CopY family transcriptional regulator [Nakamurella endophytica]|uniref:BlaI/MecI/CopY family transcriptional regulator n=1 Tax=Nakamurella endophytica TaxID=1748367 RepID=UPI00166380D4|nr:BlaI/MecI/CopY family transcriptional regulator [Nakamurella endophytica]